MCARKKPNIFRRPAPRQSDRAPPPHMPRRHAFTPQPSALNLRYQPVLLLHFYGSPPPDPPPPHSAVVGVQNHYRPLPPTHPSP